MEELRLNQFYNEFLPKVEPFCWALAIIGYLLKWGLVQDGNTLLVLGMAGSAQCLFLRAFAPNSLEQDGSYDKSFSPQDLANSSGFFTGSVAPKIACIGGAATLYGILLKLMNWGDAFTTLLVGILSMLVAIVAMAIGRYRIGLRTLIVACLGLLAIFTPSEILIRQFHRDNPALAEQLVYQFQHSRDAATTATAHASSLKN